MVRPSFLRCVDACLSASRIDQCERERVFVTCCGPSNVSMHGVVGHHHHDNT